MTDARTPASATSFHDELVAEARALMKEHAERPTGAAQAAASRWQVMIPEAAVRLADRSVAELAERR
jgi:hypothetical protein